LVIGSRHFASAALAAVLVASFFGLMEAARAQDEDDLIEDANAKKARDVQVVRIWHLALNRNVWAALGNEFGTMKEARDKLDALFAERIDAVELSCPLTEPQRKKLLVAGRGEIKRFLDRLDALRTNDVSGIVNGENVGGDSTADLQVARQGLLGEGSLFAKTLAKTLGEAQFAKYKADVLERSRFPYREAVYQAAKSLQKSLGLSKEQRQRLEKLLVEETQAPKTIGRGSVYSLVIFQASRIPEGKLKPIFTEAQWQSLSEQLAPWRWGNGAVLFEDNGYVFADKPAAARPIVANPAGHAAN
jgi:hypothetical protein